MEDCRELSECYLCSRSDLSPMYPVIHFAYPAYKVNANGNGCCRFWCFVGEGTRPHYNNTRFVGRVRRSRHPAQLH